MRIITGFRFLTISSSRVVFVLFVKVAKYLLNVEYTNQPITATSEKIIVEAINSLVIWFVWIRFCIISARLATFGDSYSLSFNIRNYQ